MRQWNLLNLQVTWFLLKDDVLDISQNNSNALQEEIENVPLDLWLLVSFDLISTIQ